MRGEPGDILIVNAIIVIANSSGSNHIVNTQLSQPKGRGVSSMMLSAVTIDDLLASKEVAVDFAVHVENCIGLLGATVERTLEKCKSPHMLDELVGAAAVVVAEEELNSGILE